MEREPRQLRGQSSLWDIPCGLTVSKVLYESEAHKRASQYSTGKGFGWGPWGYPCFTRRKFLSFTHTLETIQFVLGILDYPQGQDTQP